MESYTASLLSKKLFPVVLVSLFILFMGLSPPMNDTDPFEEHSDPIEGTEQSIEVVPVPGGIFTMWDAESGASHQVEVDSFWIGKYEISWNQYTLFMDESLEDIRRELYYVLYGVDIDADAVSSPTLTEEVLELLREADISADVISKPSPPYGDMTGGMGVNGFPAVSMTQYAAHMFTRWLTIKTGEFYRLPTEAEWEYACRASQTDSYTPPDEDQLGQQAWYRDNSNRSYQQVDSKEPNELGIYNMLGNVNEWTLDQYHTNYIEQLDENPASNPWFKPEQLYPRTARGGSWTEPAEAASCLQRKGSQPSWKMNDPQLPKSLWWHTNAPFVGFRVVKPKNQPGTVDEIEAWWIDAMQDYF